MWDYASRMSGKTLTEQLRVNVSVEQREALEVIAEREDRSVAAVIRRAIREFIVQHQHREDS